jgi:hypothetical protein
MKSKNRHGVDSVDLARTVEFHLRNANFNEEIIDEIVEALEWKLEFNKYKEELGIKTS